jgi:polyisoprenoid-binding protein YceI
MTLATEGQTSATSTWKIDPAHSNVQFSIRHMMVTSVHGRFSHVDGTIVLDESDLSKSWVEVDIDAASLDTNQAQRDAHVKSPDFLDVERYPTITFKSTRIELKDANRARVIGDLTMHGTTREVVLDTEYFGRQKHLMGHHITGFNATTTLSRKDFDLTWNAALEAGGWALSDSIKINIDVEAVQQS